MCVFYVMLFMRVTDAAGAGGVPASQRGREAGGPPRSSLSPSCPQVAKREMEEAKAAQEQHRLAEIAYAKEAAEAKAAQEAADIATANAIREQAEASAAHASWCVELSAKAEADSAYQRAQVCQNVGTIASMHVCSADQRADVGQ
jgi:hypothetical protein